jgi:RNA polymerase sigma-70 factor (ECF subfamily)
MDSRSDGELLAAWGAGESRAFELLVERFQGPLLRHARALLGDRREGEDVVQEALLRLAQKPPSIPAAARGDRDAEHAVVAAWLHQVTRNLCMDTLRGETRRRAREEAVAQPDLDHGGLSGVEQADMRVAVERGLAKLPQDQREVLVLRLLGERSYKEIAEITGKKLGTVGWLISAGVQALSRELAPLAALEPAAEGIPTRTPQASRLGSEAL